MQSLMETIDANYTLDHTAAFLYKYLAIPPLVSAVYLLVIFSGKKWMEEKTPYDLRTLLTLWNFLLASYSIAGFLIMAPPIFKDITQNGFTHSICYSPVTVQPWLSFWAWLFVWSKVVEFGDTIFIVLRKSPLSFLHWYHHITVLMYSWYGLATRNTAGHWFSTNNLGVHAVMYTYYMLKALGFKIPSYVAKCITIVQLTQFVVGLMIVFTGVWLTYTQQAFGCGMTDTHIKAGLIMYGSYFVLFMNFFYHRYIKVKAPRKKKE